MVLPAHSSFAQWPTLDITAIKTMISSNSEEIEQTAQTAEKTMLEAENLAATGAPSKTLILEDAKEKAEKAKEKAERVRKRLEWLQKKKEQYEKLKERKEKTQMFIEQGKDLYLSGKQAFEQGEELFDDIEDSGWEGATQTGQENLNYGQQTPDSEKEIPNNNTEEKPQQNTQPQTPQNQRQTPSAPANNNTAPSYSSGGDSAYFPGSSVELPPENEEFSEGAWNIEGEEPPAVTNGQPEEESKDSAEENEQTEEVPEVSENEQNSEGVGDEASSDEPQRRAFRKPSEEENQTEEPSSETSDEESEEPSPATQTSAVERIYFQNQMAFAQEGCSEYKTGSDEEGTFIFSDIIANKCCMGLEDLNEESIQECIRTWVFAMNDPDASDADEAKNEYDKALHDHISADAVKSLDGVAYAASFKKDIAEELRKKSEITTSIRDEEGFMGKLMQTNVDMMMHLLEINASDLTYDSLKEVKILTKEYYDENEEEK